MPGAGRGYLLPYRQKQQSQPEPLADRWAAWRRRAPDYSAKLDKLIDLQEQAIASRPLVLAPSPGPD